MKIRRREFLAQSLAGVEGLILAPRIAGAQQVDPYSIRQLGNTPLQVSGIGLGTGMRGFNQQSNQTRLGIENFHALIRGCYDRGVRFFDLADMYGSHPYIVPALDGIPRDRYVISTKIMSRMGRRGGGASQSAEQIVERFLGEMKTDYIDMVLLHCMISGTWNTEQRSMMDGLEKLKEQGVIRAHGVSCHSIAALKTAAAEPWVDSVHARINAYGNKMDGAPEEVAPILRQIHAAGKGLVGMKLIGEGDFRNSLEQRRRSVEYVLGLGCVDSMIVGFESLAEVDDFASCVQKVSTMG